MFIHFLSGKAPTWSVVSEFPWRTINFFKFQGATFFSGKKTFVDKRKKMVDGCVVGFLDMDVDVLKLFLMDGINLSFL